MRSITVAFKYFFLYFLHLCSYLFGRVATLSFAARNNRNRKRAFEEVARWLTSNGGGQSTYPSPPSFPSLPPLSLACSRDLNDAELVFFSLLLFLSASSAARFPVIENFRVCSFYSIFFFALAWSSQFATYSHSHAPLEQIVVAMAGVTGSNRAQIQRI